MYNYEAQKLFLFTDEGQRMLLKIRDKTANLLTLAGACRCQEMMSGFTGDMWNALACVDRLVELGELKEITGDIATQYRVFVRKY